MRGHQNGAADTGPRPGTYGLWFALFLITTLGSYVANRAFIKSDQFSNAGAHHDSPRSPQSVSNQATNQDRSIEFRDLFLGAAGIPAQNERASQLVYLPVNDLVEIPAATVSAAKALPKSGEALLDGIGQALRSQDPFTLHEKAASQPAKPVALDQVHQLLRGIGQSTPERLTVVLVPGIFGEFIETRAFEDVLSKTDSAFKHFFDERVAAAKKSGQIPKSLSFSMQDERELAVPISDLISAGSIDDENGQSMVNILLLNTPLLSLESLGRIEDRAKLFNSRMNQIFQVLYGSAHAGDLPGPILMIGYSRGTMIGLEMLAQGHASPAEMPWLSKVAGMVSLGGVVYGSDLADDALNLHQLATPPAGSQQLTLLRDLKSRLAEAPEGLSGKIVMAKNLGVWTEFIKGMSNAMKPKNSQSLWEKITSFNPAELKEEITNLKRVDFQNGWKMLLKFGFQTFDLKHAFTEYNANIRRFIKLAEAVLNAVPELSTPARLQWWKTHTVPNTLKYYALAGTMIADPGTGARSLLSRNNSCFNTELQDYTMLMKNHMDFVKVDGQRINDSQVAAHKVRFWNELNQLLNPNQPEISTHFLGVVGTHHWGLALRVVNAARSGSVRSPHNPFPREALLKAIAGIVAKDLQTH